MTAAASERPIDRVLGKLPDHRRNGSGWMARCCAHDDRHASLSISEATDGRVLLHCLAGCETPDIVRALGLAMSDLFAHPGLGGAGNPRSGAATVQPLGCTVEQYAALKRLPVDSLRALGLSDFTYFGAPAIRIPYLDMAGAELAVRFRIALTGDDRFRWKSGAKPQLYGRNRLHQAEKAGYVVLVEGESDCQSLWHHGEPALGIPGASLWRDDRDAEGLEELGSIYLVLEPDRGGETLFQKLAQSKLRDRIRLVRLAPWKDVSEMHCDDPDAFPHRWEAAKASAISLSAVVIQQALERRVRLAAAAQALAREPDILGRFAADLERAGVVGEQGTAKLLYLAITSRLLADPVSVAVKGPSSGGKSFVVDRVLRFFPPSAYYSLSAMSERALAYSEEPLAHRFLVLFEAVGLSSDFASYLVRSLLSEGRLRYETVEKTRDGLRSRLIERDGPTGLIVTTTEASLHPENETRMLSVVVTDTPEQTRRILHALAGAYENDELDFARWHALQDWLETGDDQIVVPYAQALADEVPPIAVRLRRDFRAVLTLIRAHALIHQVSRERDGMGRIMADGQDYEAVRELTMDLVAERIEAGVPSAVCEAVEAVRELASTTGATVSNAQVGRFLKIDKSTALRRIAAAIDHGYLKNLEERERKTAKLVIGEPLPEDVELFPSWQKLQGCMVAAQTGGMERAPLSLKATAEGEAEGTVKGARAWNG